MGNEMSGGVMDAGRIEDRVVRVPWQEAMEHLKPMLNGYRRHNERIYIGVTSNPDFRWQQHALDGWDRMVLIYEAKTPKIAVDLERDLIDYARRCNFQNDILNDGAGGEGITGERRVNFLYVLLGGQRGRA